MSGVVPPAIDAAVGERGREECLGGGAGHAPVGCQAHLLKHKGDIDGHPPERPVDHRPRRVAVGAHAVDRDADVGVRAGWLGETERKTLPRRLELGNQIIEVPRAGPHRS